MMKKIVSLVVMLFLLSGVCFAKVKNYKAEGTEDIPSNKTQDEIVSSLFQSLTKQAIEQSGIKLSDYKLSNSEYNQFVQDVTKVEVKNKKIFMKKDNLQSVNIKLNVAMDIDVAKAYLDKIKSSKEAKEKQQNVKKETVNLSSAPAAVVNSANTQVSSTTATPANVAVNKVEDDKTKAEDKVKTEISTSTTKVEKPIASNVNVSSVTNVTEKAEPKEKISIEKALQEAQKTKQEVKSLLDNFDNSLKESNDEIIKSYDSKISKINLNIKKDQWETTKQYNSRIEKNKQEKQTLEQEKEKSVSDNKTKIAQMVVSTIKPQIEKLKLYQTDKFYDETSTKAKVVSLGTVNADEKYFDIKILYDNDQSIISTLKYDFSNIDIEQAKEIYETPNKFVIEPLFSVEENEETGELQKVLTAFGIKHTDIVEEKIVNLSEKIKPFKEITKFETYNKIINKK